MQDQNLSKEDLINRSKIDAALTKRLSEISVCVAKLYPHVPRMKAGFAEMVDDNRVGLWWNADVYYRVPDDWFLTVPVEWFTEEHQNLQEMVADYHERWYRGIGFNSEH